MPEVSKMSVRFCLLGAMSKVVEPESPEEAIAVIEHALVKGLYACEPDRRTGKDRFLTFYPPKSIVRVEIQAFNPDIPDQIEAVIRNLGAIRVHK